MIQNAENKISNIKNEILRLESQLNSINLKFEKESPQELTKIIKELRNDYGEIFLNSDPEGLKKQIQELKTNESKYKEDIVKLSESIQELRQKNELLVIKTQQSTNTLDDTKKKEIEKFEKSLQPVIEKMKQNMGTDVITKIYADYTKIEYPGDWYGTLQLKLYIDTAWDLYHEKRGFLKDVGIFVDSLEEFEDGLFMNTNMDEGPLIADSYNAMKYPEYKKRRFEFFFERVWNLYISKRNRIDFLKVELEKIKKETGYGEIETYKNLVNSKYNMLKYHYEEFELAYYKIDTNWKKIEHDDNQMNRIIELLDKHEKQNKIWEKFINSEEIVKLNDYTDKCTYCLSESPTYISYPCGHPYIGECYFDNLDSMLITKCDHCDKLIEYFIPKELLIKATQ
jgi:hypothetical protein